MPLGHAPGWRVVERRRPRPPGVAPQLAPLPVASRPGTWFAWTAGVVLSLLVLAVALLDQSWVDGITGRPQAVAEAATGVAPADRGLPPSAGLAGLSPTTALPRSAAPRGRAAGGAEGRGEAKLEHGAPAPAHALQPASEARRPPADVEATHAAPVPLPRLQMRAPEARPVRSVAPETEPGAAATLIGLRDDVPAAGAGIRVFIHYTASADEAAGTAERLAAFLRRRGFSVADIRPVEMRIRTAGVRYFFERDLPESRQLAEELRWFFRDRPQQAPDQVSDFTHYEPRPRPGNVEVWLPTS